MTSTIIDAIATAFSFLTILPAPRVDWTPPRLRFFPLALPLVGVVVGLMGAGLFWLLSVWRVSDVLRAVLMTLFYLGITGGLHMDGLMDTCDAVFSRRDRKTRLEILSDTHVGAFAVMGCVAVLLLKAGIFSELFGSARTRVNFHLFPLILIPVYSRLGLGVLLFLPFAREDGLARTLGSARVPGDRRVLIVLCALLSLPFLFPFTGGRFFAVPLAWALSLFAWGRCCRGIFGGVTGDLLGAFVELSETLMLLALAASL